MLTDNEDNIINFLLNSNSFVTAKEIANQFLMSTKTVYRTIKHLNSLTPSGELINSKKGRGFKINYDNYLKEMNYQQDSNTFTAKDRQQATLTKLLMIAPRSLKLSSLFSQYYLSETNINEDLKSIRSQLASYSLNLVRKNHQLKITGSETNIRHALQDILIKQNFSNTSLSKKGGLNFYSLQFCIKQLNFINEKLDSEITYPYNVNIISHIYILITRYQTHAVAKSVLTKLNSYDQMIIKENKQLYSIAAEVIKHIENYLDMALEPNEIYFLLQYLISSRLDVMDKIENSAFQSNLVQKVTNFYISNVVAKLNLGTINNDFKDDLANHIRPMINRLYNKISLNNALLPEIKRVYLKLFKVIEHTSDKLTKELGLPPISADESGFITIYFARYLEQNRQYIRALVVCTTGVATAQLIKVKIQSYFNNIIVVADAASSNVQQQIHKYAPIELIISTIPLNNTFEIPVVVVGALLTNQDKKRIEDSIKRNYHFQGSEKMLSEVTNESLIRLNIEAVNWKDAIRKSADPLVKNGYATENYVNGMIKTTEESGPYIVISKGVALPHARPELGAKKIGITVTTLKTPIKFGNKSNDPVQFIFALCAVDNKSHLKAMSELVNFISDQNFLKSLVKETRPANVYTLIKKFESRYSENE
ncbi:Transcriptional antiterminator of lichenan operon, BglG family [Lactobacillus sp. wkB8]|uniref:BglG family transcription antiterminator n=1 Tax=Lactobacillus sp. wkB8 TaxID=1545702 RepID=UPI00050D16FB|nr:BglG family transcription antiterminator [Lactobacillus sp. wkB8]AIS10039.1 Transcriptional antiterminator of lichenan operon, BglG family [Lactobacillus sp. wkB8]